MASPCRIDVKAGVKVHSETVWRFDHAVQIRGGPLFSAHLYHMIWGTYMGHYVQGIRNTVYSDRDGFLSMPATDAEVTILIPAIMLPDLLTWGNVNLGIMGTVCVAYGFPNVVHSVPSAFLKRQMHDEMDNFPGHILKQVTTYFIISTSFAVHFSTKHVSFFEAYKFWTLILTGWFDYT